MSAAEHANAGAMPVRPEHRLDEARLAAWLAAHVEGFAGPLEIRQFRGGQSNPTYKLITPAGDFVLRRKPRGELLKGAHAVEREARVLAALAGAGYPAPRVHGLCTDEAVIGAPFFVMECVEGRIFWDATFPTVPRSERARYFDAMNATIARLHAVDFEALGLGDYGRAGDYLARQIALWSRQYLADPDAGRDKDMDALVEWLPRHVPAGDETSLVHGDFRCDNLVFHPTEPRILAVLDWELSTLGHPLADFAYHALMYRMPPDIVAGLGGADLAGLGVPSEADYCAAYCERTGRDSLPDYPFHVAFSLFRLAAIFHGIRGRVIRGTASSAHARQRAEAFPRLARMAGQAMEALQ
jgi:aminoglycoside phosphotransferase (APT) family kinase protein